MDKQNLEKLKQKQRKLEIKLAKLEKSNLYLWYLQNQKKRRYQFDSFIAYKLYHLKIHLIEPVYYKTKSDITSLENEINALIYSKTK